MATQHPDLVWGKRRTSTTAAKAEVKDILSGMPVTDHIERGECTLLADMRRWSRRTSARPRHWWYAGKFVFDYWPKHECSA